MASTNMNGIPNDTSNLSSSSGTLGSLIDIFKFDDTTSTGSDETSYECLAIIDDIMFKLDRLRFIVGEGERREGCYTCRQRMSAPAVESQAPSLDNPLDNFANI